LISNGKSHQTSNDHQTLKALYKPTETMNKSCKATNRYKQKLLGQKGDMVSQIKDTHNKRGKLNFDTKQIL